MAWSPATQLVLKVGALDYMILVFAFLISSKSRPALHLAEALQLTCYDSGDRRADYLCMEYVLIKLALVSYLILTLYSPKLRPDGRTTGALNLGENDFQDIGQIKHSEGYDRASKYTIALQSTYFC